MIICIIKTNFVILSLYYHVQIRQHTYLLIEAEWRMYASVI